MMQEVQRQDGDQHQQPAELREEEKLHGGVHAALVAPDGDQEVHRDQHQFPGEVEQEQIDRQEHAGDAGQDPQQVEVEEADASVISFQEASTERMPRKNVSISSRRLRPSRAR